MREINNNTEVSKVQKADFKAEKQDIPFEIDEKAEVVDFANPHAEVLGRSQISKVDNLKNDIDFGMANPETVDKADKFFDMAYAQLLKENDPDAYSKAASRTKAYVDEFHS